MTEREGLFLGVAFRGEMKLEVRQVTVCVDDG